MRVSARECGRQLGISHVSVLKAIKRGRIKRRKDGTIEMNQFGERARRGLLERLHRDFGELLSLDVSAAGDILADLQKSHEAAK